MQIDGDQWVCRHHRRRLNDIQTDAARTEHHDRVPDLHLGVIDRDTESGCHSAAKQCCHRHIAVGRNRRNAIFGNDRIFVESGHPSGIDDFAVPFVFRRDRFNAQALAPVQHNLVTRFNMTHAGAGFHHDSRAFVAQQVRKKFVLTLGTVNFT